MIMRFLDSNFTNVKKEKNYMLYKFLCKIAPFFLGSEIRAIKTILWGMILILFAIMMVINNKFNKIFIILHCIVIAFCGIDLFLYNVIG